MIHRPIPSPFLRRAVTLAGLGLLVAVSIVGLQAQAETRAQSQGTAPDVRYEVAMTVSIHGQTTTPRLVVGREHTFAVAGEAAGKPWRVEFTLDRLHDAEQVRLAGRITDDGKLVAAPVLVGSLGQRVAVQMADDLRVALVVREI